MDADGVSRGPGPGARGAAWGSALLALVAVGLMVLGALVRAHGAGLACPDWPQCFGAWIPRFNLKIAFEVSHRALAGLVSLSLAALSAAILWRPALREAVRAPLAAAWVILVAQVVLGGLTVLLSLAPWTVTAHLIGGTSLCVALVWISRDLFELGSAPRRAPLRRPLALAIGASAALLALQLVLGGLVSSQAAGLACPDFPRCSGPDWAPTLRGLVGLHVLHRGNALLVIGALGALVALAQREPRVSALAWLALRLALVQAGVGALNVIARLPVEVTALHSALAAALALTTAMLVRELVRCGVAARAGAAAASGALLEPGGSLR